MDRAQKAESIESLKSVFADAGAVVVTHNLGLTVAEMEDLRGRLRKEGGAFKVVKNRLALKALGVEEGSAYHDLFKGPVGIAYATWSGLGMVLIAAVGWIAFGQKLDAWALLGMALVVAGVLIMNLLSTTATH